MEHVQEGVVGNVGRIAGNACGTGIEGFPRKWETVGSPGSSGGSRSLTQRSSQTSSMRMPL
jgi:hypothetical protein